MRDPLRVRILRRAQTHVPFMDSWQEHRGQSFKINRIRLQESGRRSIRSTFQRYLYGVGSEPSGHAFHSETVLTKAVEGSP